LKIDEESYGILEKCDFSAINFPMMEMENGYGWNKK
jgi:hypothetical protein